MKCVKKSDAQKTYEEFAKKSETLYNLDEDDIDNIYDVLDETLP